MSLFYACSSRCEPSCFCSWTICSTIVKSNPLVSQAQESRGNMKVWQSQRSFRKETVRQVQYSLTLGNWIESWLLRDQPCTSTHLLSSGSRIMQQRMYWNSSLRPLLTTERCWLNPPRLACGIQIFLDLQLGNVLTNHHKLKVMNLMHSMHIALWNSIA